MKIELLENTKRTACVFLNLMVLKSIGCPQIVSCSRPLNNYIFFADKKKIGTYNPLCLNRETNYCSGNIHIF